MKSLDFDIPLFLWYISWSSDEVTRNADAQYARTAFLHSKQFPLLLDIWRNGHKGTVTRGAQDSLDPWSVKNTEFLMNKEMEALAPYMLSPQSQLSEESLLAITLEDIITEIKTTAPITFQILDSLSCIPKQALMG